jgi:hypothetical protein
VVGCCFLTPPSTWTPWTRCESTSICIILPTRIPQSSTFLRNSSYFSHKNVAYLPPASGQSLTLASTQMPAIVRDTEIRRKVERTTDLRIRRIDWHGYWLVSTDSEIRRTERLFESKPCYLYPRQLNVSNQYTLPCPGCRKKHAVQSSQAGTSIECKCGRTIQVPSMRGMRELQPIVEQTTEQQAEKRRRPQVSWGMRQGIALACLTVGGIALGFAIFLFATKPEHPTALAHRFFASQEKQMDEYAANMTLAQSLIHWKDLNARGIAPQVPVPAKLTQLRDDYLEYQIRLTFTLAIAIIALALFAGFRFWRKA